jgi:hypothetical protein
MFFLLHGAPGVGKALTAGEYSCLVNIRRVYWYVILESIGGYVARPLFVMRIGDLGTDAKGLEKSLNEAFELSAKWNSIILLGEVDVFLDNLAVHDLNGLQIRNVVWIVYALAVSDSEKLREEHI